MIEKKLYLFNIYNLMSLEVSIYTLQTITTIYAINISIISKSFLSSYLFSCFVTRTLNKRSTLLANFKIYNRVLLTIGNLLYIRSRIHSSHITKILCPLTNTSLFAPSPFPGNHHSTLCFYFRLLT